MLRNLIATHARKAALSLAALAALLSWCAGVALMVSDQLLDISTAQTNANAQVTAIRQEVVGTLRQLNKDFQPACGPLNLQAVREMLFTKRYIGDIGTFDAQGRLACTTTVGTLATPVVDGPPDIVDVGPDGEAYFNQFNIPVMAARPDVRTTISRLGRFNVVIYPHAQQDVLATGVSAVFLRTPDGTVKPVVRRTELTAPWQERFLKYATSGEDFQRFEWAQMAFVAQRHVVDRVYGVQTVVPLSEFIRTHQRYLGGVLGLSLLIGVLVFLSLKPVFLGWRALEHRMPRLLVPQNIICMFQPIVDLQTGRPVGCEVLMRLRDGGKVIFPDHAIPAIIARGLTWKLDQLVVQQAIRELAQALPGLKDFKVAFNFFPDNVVSGQVRALFNVALLATPHTGLIFDVEVIEQHFNQSMLKEVAELRQHDFLVSVDDFGTGFSNLGSVKAISPDFLKIDRSFVMDMEDDSVRSSLIPEIVGIGRAVGAKIIAEGIENERQMMMLKSMGVEFGQGYYFARPQPIAQFAEYLRATGP